MGDRRDIGSSLALLEALPRLTRQRRGELDLHAAVDPAHRRGEARVVEDLEHAAVLGQDVRDERLDAGRRGGVREVREQDRGDAMALPGVGDREGDLGRIPADVRAVAHDGAFGPAHGEQRQTVGRRRVVRGTVEVDAGAEVAKPARLLGERGEEGAQSRLVLGRGLAHMQGGAVAQDDVGLGNHHGRRVSDHDSKLRTRGARAIRDPPRDAAGFPQPDPPVYQDLALCDNLDVVANLFLGGETLTGARVLDEQAMEHKTLELLDTLGVTSLASVRARVGSLSGGQRQSVAITRSLLGNPRLVILDEPTAALGVVQTAQVLELVHRLREQGLGVVVISHNLENVYSVADRIVVLRLGRVAASFDRRTTPREEVVAAITGAAVRPPA